jgi:hypothetical protein
MKQALPNPPSLLRKIADPQRWQRKLQQLTRKLRGRA